MKYAVRNVLVMAFILSLALLYLDNLMSGKSFCDNPHPEGSVLSLFCPTPSSSSQP